MSRDNKKSEKEKPKSPKKSEKEKPKSPKKSEKEKPKSPKKSEKEKPKSPKKSEKEKPKSPKKSEKVLMYNNKYRKWLKPSTWWNPEKVEKERIKLLLDEEKDLKEELQGLVETLLNYKKQFVVSPTYGPIDKFKYYNNIIKEYNSMIAKQQSTIAKNKITDDMSEEIKERRRQNIKDAEDIIRNYETKKNNLPFSIDNEEKLKVKDKLDKVKAEINSKDATLVATVKTEEDTNKKKLSEELTTLFGTVKNEWLKIRNSASWDLFTKNLLKTKKNLSTEEKIKLLKKEKTDLENESAINIASKTLARSGGDAFKIKMANDKVERFLTTKKSQLNTSQNELESVDGNDIKTKLDNLKIAEETKLSTLESQITTLESQINDSWKNQNTEEITQMRKDYTALNNEKLSIKSKITRLDEDKDFIEALENVPEDVRNSRMLSESGESGESGEGIIDAIKKKGTAVKDFVTESHQNLLDRGKWKNSTSILIGILMLSFLVLGGMYADSVRTLGGSNPKWAFSSLEIKQSNVKNLKNLSKQSGIVFFVFALFLIVLLFINFRKTESKYVDGGGPRDTSGVGNFFKGISKYHEGAWLTISIVFLIGAIACLFVTFSDKDVYEDSYWIYSFVLFSSIFIFLVFWSIGRSQDSPFLNELYHHDGLENLNSQIEKWKNNRRDTYLKKNVTDSINKLKVKSDEMYEIKESMYKNFIDDYKKQLKEKDDEIDKLKQPIQRS